MAEKICRLCLQTITETYQTIDESTFLTLKLNPRISNETVICTECASYLEVFSNLKPACVYMRDSILPFTVLNNDINLDPTHETTSNLKSPTETGIKCSFCAKINGRAELVSLNDSKRVESLVNLLKQHIPEMNLKNTEELLTCETCLGTLRGLFNFISKCLEVEEKINKYAKVRGTDRKGQIALKDIQQFIVRPKVKLEIGWFGVNELEEKCDRIQKECTVTAEAEIKYEKGTNNPETVIKTEDVNIKSEHSDSESFQFPFDAYKIAVHDPLEISVLTSETTPKKYIKQHLLDHQNSSEVDAELCSYKKNPQIHLLTHKTPSEVPMFKCELCPYQTKCKKYLRPHLLTHKSLSEVPMFKCELCPYQTKRKGNLRKHLVIHKTSSEVPMFKCESCSYQTKHKEYIRKHVLSHKSLSEVPTFKCEFCSYRAKYKKCLRKHLLSHKAPSEVPVFKCELCSYQTKDKQYLKKHFLCHKTLSEVTMFKCELCSYQTNQKRYLQKHALTHKTNAEVPIFKCELCPHQTKHKQYLQKHLLTHKTPSEVPMFKCKLCPYQTKHKSYLPIHLLTHRRPSEVMVMKCDSFVVNMRQNLNIILNSTHEREEKK